MPGWRTPLHACLRVSLISHISCEAAKARKDEYCARCVGFTSRFTVVLSSSSSMPLDAPKESSGDPWRYRLPQMSIVNQVGKSATARRSAGFQTCRFAGFLTCRAVGKSQSLETGTGPADLEVRETVDKNVCATAAGTASWRASAANRTASRRGPALPTRMSAKRQTGMSALRPPGSASWRASATSGRLRAAWWNFSATMPWARRTFAPGSTQG